MLFVSSDARPLCGGVARCLDGWLTGLSELGYRAGILSLLPQELADLAPNPERRYGEWRVSTPQRLASRLDTLPLARKLRTALFLLQRHISTRMRLTEMIRKLRPAHLVVGFIDRDTPFFLRLASEVRASTAVVAYAAEFRPSALAKAPYLLPSLAKSGRVLAISAFTRELISRLPVALPAVSIVRPSLDSETEGRCRRVWSDERPDRQGPLLVTVARLVEGKGIHHAIEAVGILRDVGIAAELSIVGQGDFGDRLRRRVTELRLQEHVNLLGGLSDEETALVVQKADIFVLTPFEREPGNVEGFGLAYLEAGALAKPVIGTRTGGVPEAVLENETGLLVDPAASAQIAEAIKVLWQDKSRCRRLGESGRRWALDHAPVPSARSLASALGLESR